MCEISNFERFHRNFVPFLAQIYRVLLLSRLPKYKRNGIPPRKDFLLNEEKDVFETRNTRHHDLPRAIDSDWIQQERRTFSRTFTLISSRLDARKWIHVAARHDAARKIERCERFLPSLGEKKKVYIRLATERRRVERRYLSLWTFVENGTRYRPKSLLLLPLFLLLLFSSRSLHRSFEDNEPFAALENPVHPSVVGREFDIHQPFFSRLFPEKGVSIVREARIVRSTNFLLPSYHSKPRRGIKVGWGGGRVSANSSIESVILHL